ncbi:MAG: hypothetical protein NUV77_14005, partial [Thermoguttaceae bacterium]|nr:hypothetical protein [Thermoguttaceae bacterium]
EGIGHGDGQRPDALGRTFLDVDVEMGVENGRLMAFLSAHAEVLSKQYRDARVTVHCRVARKHLGRILRDRGTVRPRGNGNGQPEPEPLRGELETPRAAGRDTW